MHLLLGMFTCYFKLLWHPAKNDYSSRFNSSEGSSAWAWNSWNDYRRYDVCNWVCSKDRKKTY